MSRSLTTILLATIATLCACAPPRETPDTATTPVKPSFITVIVRTDGAIEINGNVVPQSRFDQSFQTLAAMGVSVTFSFEKGVNYGQVMELMDAAQRAGLSRKMGVIGGT